MKHTELISFVKVYLSKRTIYPFIYYSGIIVPLVFLLLNFLKFHKMGLLSAGIELLYCLSGVVIAFALIPIHELIHAFAYKVQGAKHTSFTVNLKKFYFLALADRFVATKREFLIVALAPFVIISSILAITSIHAGPFWTLASLTCLTTHSLFCSGDFALLSYFGFHSNMEVVTYDDKDKGTSYFYGRSK